MATRSRTSGTVAGRTPQVTGRPVYEDFQPAFEWREEPTANFLSASLPGFVKEQIKVTYDERRRTMKVRGERPLGTNKFSRFSKDFRVPENCKPGEIRGKLERGTLVLTLPKKTITQVPPEEAPPPQVRTQKQSLSTEREPKSPKVGQQNVPPVTTSSGDIRKTKSDDKVVAVAKEAVDQAKHQKGQEEAPPKATSSKASDPTPRNASRKGAASYVMSNRTAYGVGEDLGVGAKEKGDRPTDESRTTEKTEDQQQTPHDKGNKSSPQKNEEDDAQRNGTIEVSRKNNTGARLDDDDTQKFSIPKAISGRKAIETENLVGAAKRAVKGMTTGLNEDRQLIVNVGVAIVVIVALGAYLSYKYGPSTRAEH
ncbi:SHSP domain-containing protein [Psidium guajava]|nr:SHSP domain-containing protein [Psidium guajava]